MLLNQSECQQLAEAIADVEQSTDAEIVTVLSPQADTYAFIPSLWAALICLSLPLLVYLAGFVIPIEVLLTLQWGLLGVLTLVFRWPPMLRRITPRFIQYYRAAQMAKAQFLVQGIHHTEHETGVLIFVSEFERYVEVITDRGVSRVIRDEEWQQVIDQLTAYVKRGDTLPGFLACVQQASQLLAERLPPRTENPNELRNQLIVLP